MSQIQPVRRGRLGPGRRAQQLGAGRVARVARFADVVVGDRGDPGRDAAVRRRPAPGRAVLRRCGGARGVPAAPGWVRVGVGGAVYIILSTVFSRTHRIDGWD